MAAAPHTQPESPSLEQDEQTRQPLLCGGIQGRAEATLILQGMHQRSSHRVRAPRLLCSYPWGPGSQQVLGTGPQRPRGQNLLEKGAASLPSELLLPAGLGSGAAAESCSALFTLRTRCAGKQRP